MNHIGVEATGSRRQAFTKREFGADIAKRLSSGGTTSRNVHLAKALLMCALLPLLAMPAAAAELKPQAREAWTKYVRLTEARREQEQNNGFLWIDRLPEAQRKAAMERVRRGETVIEGPETRESGREIEAEDALIHHWIGTGFIPGATLKQTLALIQDYEKHPTYYAPDVEQARILKRDGDAFDVFIRFRKTKVITVVVNTWHRAVYGS